MSLFNERLSSAPLMVASVGAIINFASEHSGHCRLALEFRRLRSADQLSDSAKE
jgi:hypothetical protein